MIKESRMIRKLIPLVALLLLAPGAAFAAPKPAPLPPAPAGVDPVCVQEHKIDNIPVASGDCLLVDSTEVGPAAAPTAADIKAAGNMKAASGATLSSALTTASCRTWEQSEGSVVWSEKHVGKYCYADGDVWVWSFPGRAATGYHYCDLGSGIGYDISVQRCDIQKVIDSAFYGGYFRQNWDYFQVHVIYKGIPIYYSHDMHANVFPNGGATFHYGG